MNMLGKDELPSFYSTPQELNQYIEALHMPILFQEVWFVQHKNTLREYEWWDVVRSLPHLLSMTLSFLFIVTVLCLFVFRLQKEILVFQSSS